MLGSGNPCDDKGDASYEDLGDNSGQDPQAGDVECAGSSSHCKKGFVGQGQMEGHGTASGLDKFAQEKDNSLNSYAFQKENKFWGNEVGPEKETYVQAVHVQQTQLGMLALGNFDPNLVATNTPHHITRPSSFISHT